MKRLNLFFPLMLLTLLFAGCAQEEAADRIGSGEATLFLRLAPTLEVESRSEPETIAALWYAVADAEGRIFDPIHHKLSDDRTQLTIEGLKYGDYHILLLATAEPQPTAEVAGISRMAEPWLLAPSERKVLDESWFFRQVDLHIGADQAAVSQQIELERCVGRVDLDLQLESDYIERFIQKIEVSFDEATGVYTTLAGNGTYGGSGHAGTLDITESRSFCSLPARSPLSGTVRITAARSDGSSFVRSYTFDQCTIEAGKITRLAIAFRHPEDDDGTIYVGENDFARFQTDTMFLASEPREVFYDNTKRSFYPNRPLQASIDAAHQLHLQFYSPVPIRDVSIRCRFNNVSSEFFELAHFDLIYPFLEGSFALPVTTAAKRFTASDGRSVIVPAQPNLTNEAVTLEVVCDDPFMQKIATINSNWYVCFSPFQADEGHAYWRHMDPELCRHGVALALNMAYMFASPEFNEQLDTYRGKLLDNNGGEIDLPTLRQLIRNHSGLTLGRVTGVGGLGGGRTYGLADYCYREVYWDWERDPFANPHTYVRQAMFHEYGHCLGYSHDSTMTYGDQWTVLCATVFVELGSKDRLPVSSKTIIANLPM